MKLKINNEENMNPTFLIIDLFCGFGGTTTGFEQAKIDGNSIAKVIACINHDAKAIKSHWMNHPEVLHFEEDIRTLDLTDLVACKIKWQNIYPDAYVILWSSLECTNFSKAKGGLPRNADSRTLAEHLFRYQEALNPDYIMIENVVEFMAWGPLDDNGKPVSRKCGIDYIKWRNKMCSYGYYDQWTQLNSADFGAYTSRNRLFGCFAKNGLPITFPIPTHSKKVESGMFEDLQKWKPVKEVLDFDDEGDSIFTRKKALSDNTLERIYAGLIKFVANGDSTFIAKYYSGRPEGKVISTSAPAGTIKTIDGQCLINTFMLKYNSKNKNGKHNPPGVNDPCPTISCQGRLGIITPNFITNYFGNGFNTSINTVLPTIRTVAHQALVTPNFMTHNYGKGFNTSIESPCPTISTIHKGALVSPKYFLMNRQFNNKGASIDKPCFTLIATMDKRPPYLIEVENGNIGIIVNDDDSEIMKKIKHFMSVYGLIDIKMRMLRVNELLVIQGFPKNYQMHGTQTDAKKFIGNSVVPVVVKKWCEALAFTLINQKQKIA